MSVPATSLDDLVVVSCLRCKASRSVSRGGNVATQTQQSGFCPIILNTTEVKWLCQECKSLYLPHVRALLELMCGEPVYWNGLPHLLK